MHKTVETFFEEDADRLAILQSSIFFHFRNVSSEQKKLVQFRLIPSGQSPQLAAYMVLSSKSSALWSSMFIEINQDKVVFGKFTGMEVIESDERAVKIAKNSGASDLWLYFDGVTVYFGRQGNGSVASETLASFTSFNLPETNHLGLSSLGRVTWTLEKCKTSTIILIFCTKNRVVHFFKLLLPVQLRIWKTQKAQLNTLTTSLPNVKRIR